MPKKKIAGYIYDKQNVLGAGQYGKVYLAEQVATTSKVAVKVIDKEKINEDEYTKNALIREIGIMSSLKSPHIIRFLEVNETKNNIYIFQELATDSLQDLLTNAGGRFPEEKAIFYISQIVLGFAQLAKNGIIHRDLKPANILCHKDVLKIADFGFARSSDNMSFIASIVGSPAYMAPQVLNRELHETYTYKCDIWSFGVMCYEMVIGMNPWPLKAKTMKQLYEDLVNSQKKGIRYPNDVKISPQMKDLISGCLKFKESQRFDWYQIFKHPVFGNIFQNQENNKDLKFVEYSFAITKLRMAAHAQNLNIRKIFANFPNKLCYQDFDLALKIMDQTITQKQSLCIFKEFCKGQQIISSNQIISNFQANGFQVDGIKLSGFHRAKSTTVGDIEQIIEQLAFEMQKRNIDIEDLFNKYDVDKKKELEYQQFIDMLLWINPKLTNLQLSEICKIFDAEDAKKIKFTICCKKLCKLAMIPNIQNKDLKETLKHLKQKKQSL